MQRGFRLVNSWRLADVPVSPPALRHRPRLRLHGHDLFDRAKLRTVDRGRVDAIPKHETGPNVSRMTDVDRTMVVHWSKLQLRGRSRGCGQSDEESRKG